MPRQNKLSKIRRSRVLEYGPGSIIDFTLDTTGVGGVSVVSAALDYWSSSTKKDKYGNPVKIDKYDPAEYKLFREQVKEAIDTAGSNATNFSGWREDEGTGQQHLSYSMFVFPLIKAVQELSAELETVKAQVSGSN